VTRRELRFHWRFVLRDGNTWMERALTGRVEEGAVAAPQNVDADAEQDERRQAH
jgi:hypothetical protein